MSMKLNKPGYEQLINEDIEWLEKKVPRTLERDHIVAVLKASIEHEYPEATVKRGCGCASCESFYSDPEAVKALDEYIAGVRSKKG
jgi:hypothetical protein